MGICGATSFSGVGAIVGVPRKLVKKDCETGGIGERADSVRDRGLGGRGGALEGGGCSNFGEAGGAEGLF